MKAFVITKHAHPSQISFTPDAPEPEPKEDEVLVEVYAAGANFFDILQAKGIYQNQPPLPFVLGSEFSGVIAAKSPIPSGCPFKPGDKVFGASQGSYAERVAVKFSVLHLIPKGLNFEEAAGLYVTWPTSYEALVGRAELKKGETVLVHAGAGGVGMAAVQIAKALGARVIATAGSAAKLEVCKRYGGADEVINYTDKDWQKQVLKLTHGKGVDVIYDPVGLIKDSLKCIAWKGRALVVGFAAGQIEKLPLNLVLLKNISIVGIHWGAYYKYELPEVDKTWKSLFDLLESGRLKPVVYHEVFQGVDSVATALRALEQRKTWGKAIVRIHADDEVRAKL